MDRFKILLSGLFLIYLILDGFQKSSISFYIAGVLIVGCLLEWYLNYRQENPLKPVYVDESLLDSLSSLMRRYELELRLRRADHQRWNVTLIKNCKQDSRHSNLVKIVGRGSAPSIPEAIMRAEDDFEKRSGSETC
jgi:hypothetical protein